MAAIPGTRLGRIARKGIKAGLLPLGLLRRRRPGDVVILGYHRVGAGDREIDLPTASFERHLAELASGGDVRSLHDALSDDRGGLVVTFDDGLRDFHDHVMPLLARRRIPAVLYLATSFIDGLGDVAPDEALTWSMLRDALETRLLTIGSHTHGHTDLARASEAEAEKEMRRSKELIEDNLQVACRDFSYPWGVGSAGADRAARRLFETAALDAWRTNRRGRTDLHRLGRTPVLRSDGDGFLFRARTGGMLDGEALVYRALGRGPWRKP